MQEQRTHPRKQIEKKIEITDINSGDVLGSLVNISLGGFMLISSAEQPLNQLFQLRIDFPAPIDGETGIDLGAESLWCNDATGPGSFWTGFQIIDLSDQGMELVQRLIDNWAVS